MARNAVPKKRRSTAQPRWGWSGADFIKAPLDRRHLVSSIVKCMPVRKSSIHKLTKELLELGGRYRRYLHQDEFGPTRAERLAALRALIEQIDQLSTALSQLPRSLWQKISHAFSTDDLVVGYLNTKMAAQRVALAADRVGVVANPTHTKLVTHVTDVARKRPPDWRLWTQQPRRSSFSTGRFSSAIST